MPRRLLPLALLTLVAAGGPASNLPDSPNNIPLWPPPAPVPFLSGENELRTFKLAPGFHIQLVAQEPMVEHPVAMCFDPDGRAYVVEMRSYMPNTDGKGEDAPTGRISLLTDTDGDGVFDHSTVFLDHLVLPRAVACANGGVLVGAPPNLLFCKDTNNDGVCDQQTVLAKDYGIVGNPEHMPNTPLPALDNWIYNANYDKRLRYLNHAWLFDPIPELGQWGLSQDNFGRLYHDNNIDQLRAAVVPPHYTLRNPHLQSPRGANEQLTPDQRVYPLHDTAVDRGYLTSIMRQDTGTLKDFTAACAPVIYRGNLFPKEFQGNAFVCEPAANLIKRDIVTETPDGSLHATQAYKNTEFLASTYERFRPVNTCVGPDGALYVVDMHHGLLQHKTYLTTYCKDQYLARELDQHLLTGRIFRILPDSPAQHSALSARHYSPPHLSTASTAQLVDQLSNPNGWTRDTAQRLLVEQQDYKAIPQLKKLAASSPNPLARLHALWTLEGFGTTGPSILLPALHDSDPHLRAAAIRIAEPHLHSATPEPTLSAVMKLKDDPDGKVRLQFALTMSALGTPATDAACIDLLAKDPTNPILRDAVLSGIPGRELDLLQQLLKHPTFATNTPPHVASALADQPPPDTDDTDENTQPVQIHGAPTHEKFFVPGTPPKGQPKSSPKILLSTFSHAILTARNPKQFAGLLDLIATDPHEWHRTALLTGLLPPKNARRPILPKPVLLPAEPTRFMALQNAPDKTISQQATTILTFVHWPGEPGYVPPPPPPPLTPEERALYNKGQSVFNATCAACHKPTGLGQEGLAPPLVDSEWVLGPPGRIVRIALSGLQGPITVDGRPFSLDMPSLASMSDHDLAAAITYARRSWDNSASPITPQLVHDIRTHDPRPAPWSESELLQLDDANKPLTPRQKRRAATRAPK